MAAAVQRHVQCERMGDVKAGNSNYTELKLLICHKEIHDHMARLIQTPQNSQSLRGMEYLKWTAVSLLSAAAWMKERCSVGDTKSPGRFGSLISPSSFFRGFRKRKDCEHVFVVRLDLGFKRTSPALCCSCLLVCLETRNLLGPGDMRFFFCQVQTDFCCCCC